MNDNEIGNPPIKALIVFRENGDTDNLFVPILCDAIRTTGIDVRCSTNEFWNSDTPYDIIHFQWPEEVMEGNCDDPDRICRLKECIAFFRSRGARFVYTRLNVRPIVIRDDWEITLDVESRSHNFLVAIDGSSETCKETTQLTIRRADYSIKVVKRFNHIFFDTLRSKMMWGADGRR